MTSSYEQILKDYPEYMSKEQMRLVCHISKKTARLLLQTGLVPCVDNGKKTRNYQIVKADVIEYLNQREILPEKYTLPYGSYRHTSAKVTENVAFEYKETTTTQSFEEYPDVLSVQQAAILAGVAQKTIKKWAKKKHFKVFIKNNTYHIPKLALSDYLASPQYKRSPCGKQKYYSMSAGNFRY